MSRSVPANRTSPLKEQRVIQLLADGLSRMAAAKATGVAKSTVTLIYQRNRDEVERLAALAEERRSSGMPPQATEPSSANTPSSDVSAGATAIALRERETLIRDAYQAANGVLRLIRRSDDAQEIDRYSRAIKALVDVGETLRKNSGAGLGAAATPKEAGQLPAAGAAKPPAGRPDPFRVLKTAS